MRSLRNSLKWAWLAALALAGYAAPAAVPAGDRPDVPYRFLLVINDQWRDPGSNVIQDTGEFSMLCALLKSWGLPFDICRLDQERFDAYHLVGRTGHSLYSTVLWDAPGARLPPDGAALLKSWVEDQGVGLVAFSDTTDDPLIADLCGLAVMGGYDSAEPALPKVTGLLENPWKGAKASLVPGVAVDPRGAQVLARRGSHPALTVRRFRHGGRAVWFDADRGTAQIYRPEVRERLRRAVLTANGTVLFASYPRSVLLFMDDMGASDKTFYPGWHYQSLSEETIRTRLIEPLQRHHAVMTQNVITGFVDRKTHRILDPWVQSHVADEIDPKLIHDFSSTKRGLDEGQKAGVFDIQSHGWTHLAPDLDSPPGPMWGAPPLSLIVQQNWYKEFGDTVRKLEIPASVQRFHMLRSLEYLSEDFGIRAISLRCGGGLGSDSPPNNTMRIAEELGFGLGHVGSIYYLGRDACIPLEPVSPRIHWNYQAPLLAKDLPWTDDAPIWIGFHDHDIAMDPSCLERLLQGLGPGVRYLTFAEYCGMLHAQVERGSGGSRTFTVRYGSQYGEYFATHGSQWTIEQSEDLAEPPEVVSLPAGLGPHRVGR